MLTRDLLVTLAMGVFVFVGALALQRRFLLAPLGALSRQARQIRADDLSARVDLNGGIREIYELGRNFNAMAEDLERSRAVERDTKRELDEQLELLSRSNRELQEFAYVASHDLQEPLRKIEAFGERLITTQAERLDERGKDYLDRMKKAARRMSQLISDLLSFSRITTEGQPFEPTDLNAVLQDAVEDLQTRIEECEGTVHLHAMPTIVADTSQMRRLFQNLIGNALKYRRPGVPPIVRVECATPSSVSNGEPRDWIEIHVSDNGIGFEQKYAEQIFGVFQRLHGRQDGYEGTGIGLAVCRKVVERHGGMIAAHGLPGVGSSFVVTLPVRQSPAQPELESSVIRAVSGDT